MKNKVKIIKCNNHYCKMSNTCSNYIFSPMDNSKITDNTCKDYEHYKHFETTIGAI